jgi:hypothetical protein
VKKREHKNPPIQPFQRHKASDPLVYFGQGQLPANGGLAFHTLSCWQTTGSASDGASDGIPPFGCSAESGADWQRILEPPYTHTIALKYDLINQRQRPNQTLLHRSFNFAHVGTNPDATAVSVCTCLEFLLSDSFTPRKVLFYGYESHVFGFWLLAVQRKILSLG